MTNKTIEQKARELLAAELLASGHEVAASHIISAGKSCLDDVELAALRAIARALEQPEGREAVACEYRHEVVVRGRSAATSSGIGCLATGGRCVPGSCAECPSYTTPPAKVPEGGEAAMESWRSAVNSASELIANAPDTRYSRRAASVLAYLESNPPSLPAGAVPDGMVLVDRGIIESLVAGPFMHHHKMNELQEREAKGFDRCRELTIKNIEVFFAAREAMLAAAQQPAQGTLDGWRIIPFTGSFGDGKWEVYAPCGSGGAVGESDIRHFAVRMLLDHFAAQQPKE